MFVLDQGAYLLHVPQGADLRLADGASVATLAELRAQGRAQAHGHGGDARVRLVERLRGKLVLGGQVTIRVQVVWP